MKVAFPLAIPAIGWIPARDGRNPSFQVSRPSDHDLKRGAPSFGEAVSHSSDPVAPPGDFPERRSRAQSRSRRPKDSRRLQTQNLPPATQGFQRGREAKIGTSAEPCPAELASICRVRRFGFKCLPITLP